MLRNTKVFAHSGEAYISFLQNKRIKGALSKQHESTEIGDSLVANV